MELRHRTDVRQRYQRIVGLVGVDLVLETKSLKTGTVKIFADNGRLASLKLRLYRDCNIGNTF